ncbi:uncharacterized mitochondrial protein AtMg00810-like [Telopea speciosissima]|uniref:uncharacterized mitochondrial protein AtMg00810-like n=1 Tax=Telopea speciosissima TaxID=54955 RepID=UPI001CC4E348|nr:uncharacterized mitochondrial protein AtMg00810-like [Telopea speciosissima]
MATTTKFSNSGGALLFDPTKYRSVMGALQYVTLTRLDVSFVVNRACQFMHSPTEEHWQLAKRIIRYLKSTQSAGLLLEHSTSRSLQVFIDADWADFDANAGYLTGLDAQPSEYDDIGTKEPEAVFEEHGEDDGYLANLEVHSTNYDSIGVEDSKPVTEDHDDACPYDDYAFGAP